MTVEEKAQFKNLEIERYANFSINCKNRYSLTRTWDASKKHVMFIGLNPPTANGTEDDPTIRRVMRFSYDWGYGGVVMCNLFTMVTPYPKELNIDEDLEITKYCIANEQHKCNLIVCAWGSFKEAQKRGNEIKEWLTTKYALHINKDGSPKHPLYVKSDVRLVKF